MNTLVEVGFIGVPKGSISEEKQLPKKYKYNNICDICSCIINKYQENKYKSVAIIIKEISKERKLTVEYIDIVIKIYWRNQNQLKTVLNIIPEYATTLGEVETYLLEQRIIVFNLLKEEKTPKEIADIMNWEVSDFYTFKNMEFEAEFLDEFLSKSEIPSRPVSKYESKQEYINWLIKYTERNKNQNLNRTKANLNKEISKLNINKDTFEIKNKKKRWLEEEKRVVAQSLLEKGNFEELKNIIPNRSVRSLAFAITDQGILNFILKQYKVLEKEVKRKENSNRVYIDSINSLTEELQIKEQKIEELEKKYQEEKARKSIQTQGV